MEEKELQDETVNQKGQFNEEADQSLQMIEGLLDENEEEDPEENISDEVGDEDKDANSEIVVDDDLIEQYPTLKTLKGKPISELAKSYDNLEREYTRLSQQVKTKPDDKAPEETHEEVDNSELPDPFDDPEGFKRSLAELIDKKAEEKLKAAQEASKLEQQKAIEMQEQQKQFQEDVKQRLSKALPNIDPDEAVRYYFEQNKDVLLKDGKLDESVAKQFVENPDFLVKNIAIYIDYAMKTQQFDKQVKETAFNIAQKGLRSKPIGKIDAVESRPSFIKPTEDDELVRELYNLSLTND